MELSPAEITERIGSDKGLKQEAFSKIRFNQRNKEWDTGYGSRDFFHFTQPGLPGKSMSDDGLKVLIIWLPA